MTTRTPARNDPCHCGSGRKYKRCCLPQDEAERIEKFRASGAIMGQPDTPAGKLRRRIVRFLEEELPESYRQEALCAWEGKPRDYDGAFEVAHEDIEWLSFMDYVVHDFLATDYDAPTLELFSRQRGARLPPDERRLLESWRNNHVGFYEVQQVKRGTGWTAKDLIFGGEECFVHDVSTSRQLEQWDIVAGRLLQEPERIVLSGPLTMIPRFHRAAILQHVQEAWANDSSERTHAAFQRFMKASWPSLRRMIEEQAQRLPELHTGTGEPVLMSRTWYEVREYAKVKRQLETMPGIQYMGPDEDPLVNGERFDWIAQQPTTPPSAEGGLMLQTTWVTPEGQEGGLVLGNLTLFTRELEVFCLSKERLQRLTRLLEKRLGRSIHRKSTITQTPEEALAQRKQGHETKETAPALPPHIQQTLQRKLLTQHYTRWVDMPIPALDNLTPRQAAKNPAYQARLQELLKDFAYTEREGEGTQGRGFSPVRLIRRLLGLSPARSHHTREAN